MERCNERLNALQLMHETLERKGNDREALKYMRRFNKLNDSIASTAKANALLYYQQQFETDLNSSELARTKVELDVQQEREDRRMRTILLVCVILGLMFIIGVIVFFVIKDRREKKAPARLYRKITQRYRGGETAHL